MATNNQINVTLSGQTGTGNFAGSISPTFVTPLLGTPTSGVLTNTTGGGGLRSFQIFTTGTAATYTKPAGITSILVEVVGPGGGSGGTTGGAAGAVSTSSGGGGGGYARLWIASAAATYTYTVGVGGTAGAAGNNAGGRGNATLFGASLQATGGFASNGDTSHAATLVSAGAIGAAGGGGVAGDINVRGNCGGSSAYLAGTTLVGIGGGSVFCGGAQRLTDGLLYGGGAGGSACTTTDTAGQAGAPGLIIVWEFA